MARSAVLRAPNKLNKSDEYSRRCGASLAVVSFVASECLRQVRKRVEAIAAMTHRMVGLRAGVKAS